MKEIENITSFLEILETREVELPNYESFLKKGFNISSLYTKAPRVDPVIGSFGPTRSVSHSGLFDVIATDCLESSFLEGGIVFPFPNQGIGSSVFEREIESDLNSFIDKEGLSIDDFITKSLFDGPFGYPEKEKKEEPRVYDSELKNYDPTLKERLNATNPDSDVALNIKFKDWESHIVENIQVRSPANGSVVYDDKTSEALLGKVFDHIADNAITKRGEKTIMITHPFYLSLTQNHIIRSDLVRDEMSTYLDNLLTFMKDCKNESDVNIVVFETLHHYAAATSLLVEQELVNDVIITKYDSGYPLLSTDIIPYDSDLIFFGGGYDKKCLSASINMVERVIGDHVYGIQDLSFKSPEVSDVSLKGTTLDNIRLNRMLSLERTYDILGMKASYRAK